jgi:NitT/TauT family transport system ATP-binding protein
LGVGKFYRDRNTVRAALTNISLEIMAGDRLLVVGVNGSGKSTLLRIILGLEPPDSGIVTRHQKLELHQLAYLPQDYRKYLLPWLTLQRQLGLFGNSQGLESDEYLRSFKSLASEFAGDFEFARYPYQLSGGEQQLFAFLSSLARLPTFLALDEPFSALDVGRRQMGVTRLATWLTNHGCTFIGISHDIEDAVLLANRIVVLTKDKDPPVREVTVPLPWPRHPELRFTDKVRAIVRELLSMME